VKRIRYFNDKKVFGNTVSIYDSTDWYFIVIKDRGSYYYSAMSKDKKHYYNIDTQIRNQGYGVIDSEEIDQKIEVNLNSIYQTDVPDYIHLLMQTGSIYGEKIKKRYKPKQKKFEEQAEEYFKINQSMFSEILKDAIYGSIESSLLNRLPVFMKHRFYQKFKKGIEIHYEGEFNNIWFQCIFNEEGLMLLFDGFVPESKYSPDGYLDYKNYPSKLDLYEFIIEAFNYYHNRVTKQDFDSTELFKEYLSKQNGSK
jgi:hypothetical protein